MSYLKGKRVSLKSNSEYTEKWVQDLIAEDPTILGLGELVLRDRERRQPKAGRLDLLLQDSETGRRYEVELQLGATDETHIIRTIEYWDIEKKRYPQYDHCAVLVAEDITSRFLNVISLFNGTIPFIAIQMQAVEVGEHHTLVFTLVMNELVRGDEDEDTKIEPTDRTYWEKKGTNETVSMADHMFDIARNFSSDLEIKYNKFYIGLARNGRPFNFIRFMPQKKRIILEMKLEQSKDVDQMVDNEDLDYNYDKGAGRYRIRLGKDDMEKCSNVLKNLIKLAFEGFNN